MTPENAAFDRCFDSLAMCKRRGKTRWIIWLGIGIAVGGVAVGLSILGLWSLT
jgi:hypothetical protein